MDNGEETVYLEPQARRFRMFDCSGEISVGMIFVYYWMIFVDLN